MIGFDKSGFGHCVIDDEDFGLIRRTKHREDREINKLLILGIFSTIQEALAHQQVLGFDFEIKYKSGDVGFNEEDCCFKVVMHKEDGVKSLAIYGDKHHEVRNYYGTMKVMSDKLLGIFKTKEAAKKHVLIMKNRLDKIEVPQRPRAK